LRTDPAAGGIESGRRRFAPGPLRTDLDSPSCDLDP
jgi:hypothetical protein